MIVFTLVLCYDIFVEVSQMDERLRNAEAIVFDVGNVLLTFDAEKVSALLPEAHRDALMRAMFLDGHLWGKFDLGVQSNEEVAREIAQCAGIADAWEWPLYLLAHFPATMAPLPLYGLIDELHGMGKRLYALTNYPEPSFSLTCSRFPRLMALDGAVVSARERLAKPDPAIFRLLTARYGLSPERTLFIDDAAANVASAAHLGFQTWHYAGSDRL